MYHRYVFLKMSALNSSSSLFGSKQKGLSNLIFLGSSAHQAEQGELLCLPIMLNKSMDGHQLALASKRFSCRKDKNIIGVTE